MGAIQTIQITKIWKLVQDNIRRIEELERQVETLSPDKPKKRTMYKRRETNEEGEYIE